MIDSLIRDDSSLSDIHDFYVYAWLRQCGTPLYIGKGRGRRSNQAASRNPLFKNITAKMRNDGQEPRVVRLYECLAESEAFRLERIEIAKYGRINNGTGVLANMTDGGEGASGYSHTEDTRAKMSKNHIGIARSVAHCENIGVAKHLQPPSSGRFKGVSFIKSVGKWKASIQTDGKIRGIGYFDTAEDAAHAYDAEADKAWGNGKCYINLPNLLEIPPPRGRSKSQSARMRVPVNGFKGVCFDASKRKWAAQIYADGKNRLIGRFETEEAAARAYDAAAVAAWGMGNCYLNFP